MPKRQPRARQHLVTQAIAFILLVIGVAVALYPFYSGALNTLLDRARVARVDKANQALSAKQQAAMAKANAKLAKDGLHPDADPFTGLDEKSKLSLKRDQIGSVTVPKIKLTVPLFKTLAEQTLAIGVAVVPGTSYPTGGVNTHTVIAGHRGLVDRRLFSDLNRVKKGNLFVLKVGKRHLAYRVFRIQVVLPDDTEVLKIEAGRDLAILLTCTPYMINSHRLLLTGKRVPYTPAVAKQVAAAKREETGQQLAILIGSIAALLALLAMIGKHVHTLLLRRHLFDLWFTVVDANGAPVSGVTFMVRRKHGKALYRHQQRLAATSDDAGQVMVPRLPGGIYRLDGAGWQIFAGTNKLAQQKMVLYPTKAQRRDITHADAGWQVTAK